MIKTYTPALIKKYRSALKESCKHQARDMIRVREVVGRYWNLVNDYNNLKARHRDLIKSVHKVWTMGGNK